MAENNVPETPASSNSKYDEGTIRVLNDVEHVRTRPGMYIGGNNVKGLHHLIYEIVDNSIDEALAGFAKNILVKINADGSATIADDGRGIPVGIHPTEKIPAVEVVFATLGRRGKIRPQGRFALRHQRRAPRRRRLGRQLPFRMAGSRSQPRRQSAPDGVFPRREDQRPQSHRKIVQDRNQSHLQARSGDLSRTSNSNTKC